MQERSISQLTHPVICVMLDKGERERSKEKLAEA